MELHVEPLWITWETHVKSIQMLMKPIKPHLKPMRFHVEPVGLHVKHIKNVINQASLITVQKYKCTCLNA